MQRGLCWLLPVWALGLGSARAEPVPPAPIAAAIGGMDDVTRTVLVGAAGQLYEPGEAPGTWRRRAGGGVAVAVTGAVEIPGHGLFVGGGRTPLFRFAQDTWHAHPLPNRGSCRVAAGGLPAIAIGPHLYTWRNQGWARLRSAPSVITALWAGTESRIHVATTQGQILLSRPGGWSNIPHPLAPDDPIEILTGHPGKQPYALARSGALLRLGSAAATLVARAPALAALQPQAAAAAPDGEL
jgi:hypothetical protein